MENKQTIQQPSKVPKKNGLFGSLFALVVVLIVGFALGIYLRPTYDILYEKWQSHEAPQENPGNPGNPGILDNPSAEHIGVIIMRMGEMRKMIKEQIESVKDRIQLEENSLTVSINYEKNDPNSEECNILRKKISNMKEQLKQLESFNDSLANQDMKLREVIAMVKTTGTITENPEMVKLVKVSEKLIRDYADKKRLEQLEKQLREGLINDEDWKNVDVNKGGPQ